MALPLALTAGVARAATPGPPAGPLPRPHPLFMGTWVWQPEYITDAGERQKMLAFCRRQGFNRLLVQIPWKAGTAQVIHLPSDKMDAPAAAATHPQIACPAELAALIAEAAQQHVAVEALDGTPYMGDKAYRAGTLATVDALLAFNRTLPAGARLAGLHWDIEPYVRADWKVQATREPIEADYLQLLSETKRKLATDGQGFTLAVDIPMWYDNKTDPGDNCILAFGGQTKNLYQHVEDTVDYVGIMSYRQKATGPNSTSEMVANEMAYAERIGKWVCPAYETVPLSDTPQITFYGKSAEQLQTQRHALEASLGDRPGFGGMMIHCYPAVCAVLEPGTPTK